MNPIYLFKRYRMETISVTYGRTDGMDGLDRQTYNGCTDISWHVNPYGQFCVISQRKVEKG